MLISYNWLKSYINFDLSVEKTAEILTDIGLEVEGIEKHEPVEGGLEGLLIGKVLTKDKHPNADKLSITTVDVGAQAPLNIVCGAPNVDANQTVVVAPVGSTIYPSDHKPIKMKLAEIRGVQSMGMICAEDEIGMGESHDGILVLENPAQPGTKAAEYFNLETDHIFEIGLTPNRGDAMSHIGVARDLAAALKAQNFEHSPLILPSADVQYTNETPIELQVADAEKCPRYSAVCMDNITVKPSPDWLQQRLKSVGVRPINNIVDITNFVLKEFGQPLHAFDANKVEGNKVVVKTVGEGTSFKALDETEYKLSAEDLMICNANQPMCIAGVFGGAESGVTDNTTKLFIESAYFNATSVRRTSIRHGLRTDAAQRYEKGADPEITIKALERAITLIQEIAGGRVCSQLIDFYPNPIAPFQVTFNPHDVKRLGGIDTTEDRIVSILEDLDITVKDRQSDQWLLEVPVYKYDVTRSCDVVEEVVRIIGINHIPLPEKLNAAIAYSTKINGYQIDRRVFDFANGAGFTEIMTNSISKSKYYVANQDTALAKLTNSMTSELDLMRASMLFSGLEVVAYNHSHNMVDLKLIEKGNTYVKSENGYQQSSKYVLFATGDIESESFHQKPRNAGFHYLKSAVELFIQRLGVSISQTQETTHPELAYGLQMMRGRDIVAHIGAVKGTILKSFGIKTPVFYAELDRDFILKALSSSKVKFKPVSKYPTMRRDLSMLIDETVEFGVLEKVARKKGGKILKAINLFDVYRSEQLGADKKSYAVSFSFQDENKTLTDKQVDKIMQQLIQQYEQEIGAEIRK